MAGQIGGSKLRRNAANQEKAQKEMDRYEDAMDAMKDHTVRGRAKKHFKNGWEWARHTVTTTKPYQWAGGTFAVFLLVWAVLTTYILLDFSIRYIFGVVDRDREWYMVNAAMALAQSQAARALLAAHHARDAVCVAVSTGIIQGSSAYAEVERVLAPALLAGSFLSGIEMSFSDSADLLVVGHRLAADGRFLLTMQSTAAECFLLGVEGCIDPPGLPGQRPEWFGRYDSLPTHSATGYGTSGGVGEESGSLLVKSGWEDAPVLAPTQHAMDGAAVAWAPSYRLGFRCGASLEVAGRVTLELGSLSGGGTDGWFFDPRLGEKGEFYLVDIFGNVLASHSPADLLAVEGGQLRFSKIWELRDRGWAGELRSAFGAGGTVTEKRMLHGGEVQVTLQQLPPPLDHFVIVVAALDNWPFVNLPLYVTSSVSMGVAMVPWTVGVAVGAVLFVQQWRRNNELRALDAAKNSRSRTDSWGSSATTSSSWNPLRFMGL